MNLSLYTAAEVRALERRLADEGLPPSVLMQRAGAAIAAQVHSQWPQARRVLVLAGGGNNGGDGYVSARLLRERGIEVTVIATAEAKAPEAAEAAAAWRAAGGQVRRWRSQAPLPEADLVVDALLGIGLARALDGDLAALVGVVNRSAVPVLSVDLPSGLDADSGHAPGAVIAATRTLCLLARKRGLHTGRARDVTGVVAFDGLGVEGPQDGDAARLLDPADLSRLLPPRRPGTHKGEQGHVLVLGGDSGMSGAVRLAGQAALRAGAGWVSIGSRSAHVSTIASGQPELMVHGIDATDALEPVLRRADVLAPGPGLGQGAWSRALFEAALAADRPMVIDADALNLLAQAPRKLSHTCILTPHPGEAARLLESSVRDIESDRYATARALADRYACTVVLKGAGTLVDDGRRVRVCPFGNPGMASAGMGDALTGTIAALLAQGLAAFDAACAGVLAHALAGDRAAAASPRGLLASDLIAQLREVVNP
ncbi:NAD(P)H-hydrate dehydratase [Pseudofulvimonas gallinarii]|jgi:hydroxyethylthiazole kinase-like uncharacterized protein yjeF|uniref:Bifunctional NAD(P)H-hydrate repair enzyme n=3 Tax=Pseudofulvimonas gallinarii TaxID=634155 RepID=A0A4V3UU20_9GAMM|nr:NAD(P)H-hydrate dehydratase [Pseudofulvimonas gallinarii]TCT00743.1 NAD(P)H-hydrate epimerase [Pseudofulvimonas gallinarii]THD12781.1 hypothetical protein B1808_10765 [Pseudofulvimonas gallinarii]